MQIRYGDVRTWVIAAFALLAPAMAAAATGGALTPEQRVAIAATVADYAERVHAPGISVYIDRGGAEVYAEGFGVADAEHAVAVTPDTVFAIGSITKAFTAHAVLQLVAAGKIDPEATIGHYLTDYTGPGARVRVRELLDHTSGIPNYVNEVAGLQLRRSNGDRASMLATFAALPLAFEPGSQWSYTNSGYYLLGLLVERVSGQSYYDYIEEHITRPLGLASVSSGDDRQIVANRARGYEVGAHGLENAAPWHYLVPFSAGSLLATAGDIARYRRAVFRSDAVDPKVRALILTSHPLADGTPNQYLWGALIKSDFGGVTKYAHSGEIWGFAAAHAYYPDPDLTIAVLTNRKAELISAVSLERKIARIVLGLPGPPPPQTPTARDLERVAGVYAIGPVRFATPEVEFVARGGQLYLGFGRGEPAAALLPLVARGNGRFTLAPDDEWVFEFGAPGKDGRFSALSIDVLNGRIQGRRLP